MGLAKNIMGGGFSWMQAQAVNGPAIAPTVTAAGTTQGTATALTADINFISTAPANSGVILYAGTKGDSQIVYNGGANPVLVYPPTGSKINQVSANTGVVLPTNTFCEYFIVSSTQIIADLSA